MVRYKNEDHQQVSTELDAEMAAMGYVDDGSGNFVAAPKQAPAPKAPTAIVAPEPISQVVPVFTHQPTPTPQPQNHNWEKREADAREAQRQLSLERENLLAERQLLARERAEAMQTLQALQDQRAALAVQATYVPVVAEQVLSPEFRAEYPDIAEAISKTFAANQQEIQALKRERKEEVEASALEQEKARRKAFLDMVKIEHPDVDPVVDSEHFKQWSASQNRSTQLVLEETFNKSLGYEPRDLIEVLTRYKRSVNPTHTTPPVPPALNSVDPGGRSMDQGREPSGENDFVFSQQELADPSLIDRWMNHPNHRRNRQAAMIAFDAAWDRSVAYHNRNR